MNLFTYKIEGGRKFKTFLLLFFGTTMLRVLDMITPEILERLYYFCGGFYAGSNVLSKAIEIFKGKKDGQAEAAGN